MVTKALCLLFLLSANFGGRLFAFSLWSTPAVNASEYGVDISFPIHHYIDNSKAPFFAKRYADMMKGCYDKFSRRECDATERARMDMNLNQPRSQHNYTEIGFKKVRAPAAAWEPLIAFYEANKDAEKLEDWPRGNTYVNSWDSPSYMVSLENRSLRGGLAVKQQVWAGVKPVLEEWTGQKLEPTSLYGIRVYKDGAMLSTHVDRLPLVSSAIIQVAQDLDEPWPIEVYDHNGKAYNVTMQPGDMVLYESHTVLHGRPFPMKGRKYANVFVHFQPVNHEVMNQRDREQRTQALKKKVDGVGAHIFGMLGGDSAAPAQKVSTNTKGYIGGHEQSNHDEDHVQHHMDRIDEEMKAAVEAINEEKAKMLQERQAAQLDAKAAALKAALDAELAAAADSARDSELESSLEEDGDGDVGRGNDSESEGGIDATTHDANARFNRAFTPIDQGDELDATDREVMDALRDAAAEGDASALRDLLTDSTMHLLHYRDENGWQLLHEAIRGGDVSAVRMLVELGADVRVKVKDGGAALWIARSYLEEDHPVIQYLMEIGAPEEEEQF